MKILFANNFFGPFGGAENVMWDEANLLAREGHDVHFFATDRQPFFIPNYENARFFPAYKDFRTVSQLEKLAHLPNIFYNAQAEKALHTYLQYLKPDLVHIHNLHYHLSPSILAACKQQAVPVVMTLHDIRLICPSASLTENPNFQGLCNTGNPMICLKKKCKNGSLVETATSVAEYYLNRRHSLYQSIHTFITPSAALLELMTQFSYPREKFVHINNFMDPLFSKQPFEAQDDGYFFYFGRLSKEKGIQYLLQAMAQLPKLQVKIAGTGPYEAELKQQAQALSLSNVEFLGFQNKEAITQLVKNCRATLLPCNWFENLPLAVIESLALGKPVIASAVGGLPEILDKGRCGVLVEPENTQQLAAALQDLADNPTKAHQLGAAGYERAHTVYSAEQHLQKLLQVYQAVKPSLAPSPA